MQQITQHRRSGRIFIREVPAPGLMGPGVLVNNRASLISVGTERQMIEFGSKSLVGKAQSRPDLVKQVMEKVRRDGLRKTWQLVKSQLDVEMPMGYSSAGDVLLVAEGVDEFRPGDRVACAGTGYASHAGTVYVPRLLATRIPDDVSYEEASFVTLGAIALQGLRQADLRLGENVCVLGLGLLGLLTVQMVAASGCRVLGMDLDPAKTALARELGAHEVASRDELVARAAAFSEGRGMDAVIITASTPANDPIEVAAEISRLKGRVVAVGLVGLNVPREAFYRRELDLRLSLSYGPGRHDTHYEQRGEDYPFSYIRFTLQRNMSAFLDLIQQKKVTVEPLVTHRFPVARAHEAYDVVLGKTGEKPIGVVLEYPEEAPRRRIEISAPATRPPTGGAVGVAVIGAGSLAQLMMLPALAQMDGVRRVGVADLAPAAAAGAAQKFCFEAAFGSPDEAIADPAVNAVLVATRHGSHAELVVKALAAGKHVFVEKPLALSWDQLRQVVEVARSRPELIVQVGFNRRFAPLSARAVEFFSKRSNPLVVNYVANAGYIPLDHWVHDPDDGGGRLIGEACHFIDWGLFLSGGRPTNVHALSAVGKAATYVNADNAVITVQVDDGSVVSIHYLSDGDKSFDKETVWAIADGGMFIVHDWRDAETVRGGRREHLKLGGKGHRQEFEAFIKAVASGGPSPVPFVDAVFATAASFAAVESLHTGQPVSLETYIGAE